MLERVAQRGRGVQRREHVAARGFDVGFEPLELATRDVVGLGFRRESGRRAIAFEAGLGGRVAAAGERDTRGLTPRLEPVELGRDAGGARAERLHLLAIESDLLLVAGDGELARVRGLAGLGRSRVGLDQLDAQAAEIGFDLGDAAGGDCLALARAGQARPRRLDRLGQLAVLAREQDLLPRRANRAGTGSPGLAGCR